MNLKENTTQLQQGLDQELLLHRMTNRIRQSLELQEILTATVAETRSLLGTERVIVYRFHEDNSGEVIAESIDEDRLPSLLGLNFPADDIPPPSREWILKTRQRSIVSVPERQMGTSLLDCPETGKPLTTIEINYRPADHCHIQYLKAMGVQFSLSVPILHREKLWGLLVSHNSQPKTISEAELQVIQRVADQVSLAIAQSTLLSQAREQAQREATINRVATLLHAQPDVQLQSALEETVAIFQGSGGRLYITTDNRSQPAEIYICGDQPTLISEDDSSLGSALVIPIEQHSLWHEWIEKPFKDNSIKEINFQTNVFKNHKLLAITDLYNEAHLQPIAAGFKSTKIRGLLVVPLHYRQQFLGFLTIFRNEINTETLWAGHFDRDKRQLQPRKSFDAWRELKSGQARQWKVSEAEMAQALGTHFAMAIQQYQLYQQVQILNTNLERQVQDRTYQLQNSLDLAGVLKRVTDQIRSTLNLETILQTIVREIRKLLNTDRVVIYQFVEDWDGEVVVEDVAGSWLSLRGKMIKDDCFSGEHAYLYQAGRFRAINDVAKSDLSPCHIDFLLKIQVQANLVVPICMGEQLWGLLIAHECGSSRVWEAAEIEMLQQLADEAAIAIQQAQLYQQSCHAAEVAVSQAQQISLAAEQQKALFGVISKIRESLDLDTIFQATAREVRSLLNAERVGVFHFTPNSQYTEGEFLSEDVVPGFASVLGIKIGERCFAEDYALHYREGKVWAVNDIYESGLSDCHIKFLSPYQIRANLIVPLMEGDELWGLLCIHQCSSARNWEQSEIEFVVQIAAQLGVALQQAELLAKTQHQAQELSKTLQELQQTQAQLIQTEKMSGLGQLVAGIAHEINNPVNFIYGNLNYVEQYAEDLLNVLHLYQKHYSNPVAEISHQADAIDLDFLIDDLPKMVSSMKVGADRIRQLVLSLRNFSRLDQADRKPVNIHEGIDSTLLILQHRLKAKANAPNINIVKEYGKLPPVECYAGQLNQVFMNVISNAIDALENRDAERSLEEAKSFPSEIKIRTSVLQDERGDLSRAVIQIVDNGTGIPESLKAQIFNPFFTTKPVGKGTGLGLSISYQIVVEKHGGAFKCFSESGKGTEFWIEIPIK